MITIDQLKDVQQRAEKLKQYLAIDEKRIQLQEEELHTQAPEFWEDAKAAEAQMRKVKGIKRWIEGYEGVRAAVEELQLAFEYYKEELVTEEEVDAAYAHALSEVESLEMKNMLSHEEDQMPAVLKIVAGAGGTEAQDWAEQLMRMYQRYCEKHDYKTTITNLQEGDEAGIKTVTFNVEGDMAYGYLKSENGVHRLVRVSPYNAQGKRMTSFASVFVVPLIDDSIDITVDPAGLSWDTFRSSGAGGQNVNKVESGVRLHYKFINPLTNQPDEIVIENTETRDQPKNRENALRHLRSQLYELELEKRRQAAAKVEAGKKKIEWGSQIRSYVFDDRRVKDHRTNYQTSNVNAVMDGDIDAFIKAYLMEFPE
ncbi:MAG: peptide chain release factor 2 [Paludibacteraceae bacterium]|nr:peptide chain release factor 2 [Paludibacteraceae bacterium]